MQSYIQFGLGLLSGIILQWVRLRMEPAAKLAWAVSHEFAWSINPAQNVIGLTRFMLLENVGRKAAEDVEVTLAFLPMHLQYHPPRNVPVQNVANANVLQIGTIVPGEKLSIAMMMVGQVGPTQLPVIVSVRSRSGIAQNLPVIVQRAFPKWVQFGVVALQYIGLAAVVWGVLSLGTWIWHVVSH